MIVCTFSKHTTACQQMVVPKSGVTPRPYSLFPETNKCTNTRQQATFEQSPAATYPYPCVVVEASKPALTTPAAFRAAAAVAPPAPRPAPPALPPTPRPDLDRSTDEAALLLEHRLSAGPASGWNHAANTLAFSFNASVSSSSSPFGSGVFVPPPPPAARPEFNRIGLQRRCKHVHDCGRVSLG